MKEKVYDSSGTVLLNQQSQWDLTDYKSISNGSQTLKSLIPPNHSNSNDKTNNWFITDKAAFDAFNQAIDNKQLIPPMLCFLVVCHMRNKYSHPAVFAVPEEEYIRNAFKIKKALRVLAKQVNDDEAIDRIDACEVTPITAAEEREHRWMERASDTFTTVGMHS